MTGLYFALVFLYVPFALVAFTLFYFFETSSRASRAERSLGHERRASGSERAEPSAANLEREPSRASGRSARATERRAPSEPSERRTVGERAEPSDANLALEQSEPSGRSRAS